MHLIWDTETTGLPDWRSPSDAEHQPHLVQLAAILLDRDLVERASVSVLIKPEGWRISEEVTAIHGITHEMASDLGIPEKVAVRFWASMVYATGAQVVAHNTDFDLRIMRIAQLRSGYTKEQLDGRKLEAFCTMKACLPILNLPPTDKQRAAGFTRPKNPNLGECIRHFFGEELEGAHDAMIDARACLRVFRHLQTQAVVEPVDVI